MLRCLIPLAAVAAHPVAHAQSGDPLLPPNPKPGECYARVFVPDRLESYTETVQVEPEKTIVKAIPAAYEWAEKEVLVEAESEELELIPARYDTVIETVIVKEASKKLVPYPAEYKTTTEKVLVKPAYVTWKKGRGLIERIDDTTGEIMCRVEVPAEYKMVKKRELVKPAGVREEVIPAVTKTVKRKIMIEPPRTVKKTIPAKYQKVRYQKLVAPAKEMREVVPAKMETVTKVKRVGEGKMEWRSVLCETNAGSVVLTDVQKALKTAGYDPGAIDGVLGRNTMLAISRFQEDKNLPSGKLTMETLEALGVRSRN